MIAFQTLIVSDLCLASALSFLNYSPHTMTVHTRNESMAAGTAFAISYNSDLKKVTKENLVVFTVLYQCVVSYSL